MKNDVTACDRILVVAPHADDEVLGCGGLIARSVDQNPRCDVRVICAAVGPMVFSHGSEVTAKNRKVELANACSILGVSSHVVWNETHDSKLDTLPKSAFISFLDQENSRFRPDLVLLPYPSYHQDHQYVFDCGMSMCRPIPNRTPPWVMMYEYPVSGWQYQPIQGGSIFVDITDYMQQKLDAMAAHASQLREPPHLFSLDSIKIWATMRARECGLSGHAEMFKLLRRIIT